jgi:hypothetical protein
VLDVMLDDVVEVLEELEEIIEEDGVVCPVDDGGIEGMLLAVLALREQTFH